MRRYGRGLDADSALQLAVDVFVRPDCFQINQPDLFFQSVVQEVPLPLTTELEDS